MIFLTDADISMSHTQEFIKVSTKLESLITLVYNPMYTIAHVCFDVYSQFITGLVYLTYLSRFRVDLSHGLHTRRLDFRGNRFHKHKDSSAPADAATYTS